MSLEKASTEDTNALAMSDEEFLKLDFDSMELDQEETDSDEEEVTDSQDESDDSSNAEEEEGKEEDELDSEEGEEEEIDSESGEEEESEDSDSLQSGKGGEEFTDEGAELTTDSSKPSKKDSKTTEDSVEEVDYKQVYEELFSPFKANGKEIKVDNVTDARQLMQMGANYNKKMQGMKPHLKLLKTLENNDLLEEEKLNYLIDLSKKNPEAINKLIKDSGIDVYELDLDSDSTYKPTTHTVSDKSVDLDQVLDDIRDTKTFNTTLDVVGNKWDETSRRVISNNPTIIKVINDHMESGFYEQIQHIVDNERMFGRLEGMSDLEAYKHVGNALTAQGTQKQQNASAPEGKEIKLPTKPKSQAIDPKLKNRKKATSSTKSVAATKSKDFNPLSMSDEEFESFLGGQFV